jgi:hypothetical protein
MTVCARTVLQPDGSLLLALDPSVADLGACAYVVQSGADFANTFASLSAEDGGLISAGIVSVWMAAFGIKAVITVINGSTKNETA